MVEYRKKAYWRNLWKSIFKSKARFFSIFFIVFLGASFFAGLRNTPGTMMKTMDAYLDKYAFSDLTYVSTLGFSENDINEIKNIDGIKRIEYGYQFDALMTADTKVSGVKVYTNESYDAAMINRPDLNDGRYPTASNECLIDSQMLRIGLNIGDSITLSNPQGEKVFEIVGVIQDVRFIADTERGTNTLGDGSNIGFVEIMNQDNDFLAIPKALYDLRNEKLLYNQISINVKGASDYNVFSQKYDDYIETVNTKVKSTLSLRLSDLYDDLTADAQKELDKYQTEYDKGYESYTLSKTQFESQILEAKIRLIDAKILLADKESQYLNAKGITNEKTKEAVKVIEERSKQLQKDLQKLREQFEAYQEDPIANPPPEIQDVLDDLGEVSGMLGNIGGMANGLTQLNEADLQIQRAKLTIQQQENKLELQELKTRHQLDEAKASLDKASIEISKAQDQIDRIPKGKLYSLTRHDNAGLVIFDANVVSIQSIAGVFPFIFFLVSALVSLTTMTRMVEEQRSQSGTLRALGYSKWDIIQQYIVYVILATLIACLLGIVGGTQFFPRIIYYLYSLMLFPVDAPTVISSSFVIALQTLFVSVFVTMAATLFVCLSELNLLPAVLMRPKVPKLGKRIFLERIDIIWNRLSFHRKVTMRNIFRYKKRFLMSVIGIAGCTALIITGFGIKYSVSEVLPRQYGGVIQYDLSLRLENDVSVAVTKDYQSSLLKREEVNNVEYIRNQSIQILKNKEDLHGQLIVYQSMDNIQNFIHFEDVNTGKNLVLSDEGVIISAKTAEILNVEEGDTVDIDVSGKKYNVKISGVMKNYFLNYIYMSQTFYENLVTSSLKVNQAFVVMKDTSPSSMASLEKYTQAHDFGNVSYTSSAISDFSNQVQSLDIVVFILILCAGALNFIVLYNLTNINIQERKSEIATIKVLGFKRKEVYAYIFRENILLSMMGALFGLVFGFMLHRFIIQTVELDLTMFVRELTPWSYFIAVAITMGFTVLINFTMRRVLNKVDMVESLKSIE